MTRAQALETALPVEREVAAAVASQRALVQRAAGDQPAHAVRQQRHAFEGLWPSGQQRLHY